MHKRLRYAPWLMVCTLAACGAHDNPKTAAPTYMLYSPNGEPLNGGALGKPSCEKALSGWFDRLSAGHNDRIPREVFLRDAQIQFSRMDIDHNGFIVSEELDRFRAPYRQDAASEKQNDQEENKHKRGKKSGKNDPSELSYTLSDPVMSADTNLDFKVTPEEFMKQAQDIFARLDSTHEGALTRDEITALCKK